MTLDAPSVLLITGIMASGKTTVAQKVAERLPKSVHLHGDYFREMIVSGRVEMTDEPSDEAWAQLRLRYRLAALTAHEYCRAGFTVVYQDVIIGQTLNEVVDLLKGWPLRVVVLHPSPEVAAQRDAERDKKGYGEWSPDELYHELETNTPRFGLWLDSSHLSPDQTVDTIFARLDETRNGL